MPGKSNRLRAKEIRDVMRLVGDVRAGGHDERAWRFMAAGEISLLTNAFVAMSIQAIFTPAGPTVAEMVDTGWENPKQQQNYYQWLGSPQFGTDPMMATLTRLGNTNFGFPRRHAIEDADWYASSSVSEARRYSNCDDCLISSVALPGGGVDQLALQRRWGDKPFGRREAVLLRLFHGELQRVWIADARRKSPLKMLPDYLRRTLDALIAGASEKEAALKMQVTPSSIHSYVKQLHSRLKVASRWELLERFGNKGFAPKLTNRDEYILPAELMKN